ncbi:MAG TPA: ATP-dependent helicase HrpB, partial [Sphingobacteriaceae bacterium]
MRARFNPFDTRLPVTEVIPETRKLLSAGNTLLLSAPPGAGKSTVLPLALLDEPWLAGQKILVLEPRRLAAISIAGRMADLLGEQVGNTIGYRIRFENRTSRQTRIEVVTEGILTRMLHHDNALDGVGLILFDEFHERSIHADISLALAREIQEVLRPDLRLVIMSATLDLAPLADMLHAPVVESEGRVYPVELIYTGHEDLDELPERCSRTILEALRDQPGDLLAFLPGQAEIRKVYEILRRQPRGVMIHPLYGQLTYAEQQAALVPDPQGRRKVVLATAIAETSLTIEGVRIVVDSGLTRKSVFDPGTGLSGLKTVRVSVDAADQRAGRAGRLSPGVCYRMWSVATHSRLAPYRTPEILDSDLGPLVMDLLQWGIRDASDLDWLNPPPATALTVARELLASLGAIANGQLTPHGKRIHRLPCHPRLANMLIMADEAGSLPLATDLAALLEERDPLDRQMAGADLNLRIERLRRFRSEPNGDKALARIERVAAAYRKLFNVTPENTPTDSFATGFLVASAYPERIAAAARSAGEGLFRLANGQTAALNPSDDLSHEPWLAVAELDGRKGTGKIFLAAPLNPVDVSHLAAEAQTIRWDSRKGQLLMTADRRIGSLVLESRPLDMPDPENRDAVLADTIRSEGRTLLNFGEKVGEWQNRVLALRRWNPEQNWPDVSTDALLARSREWLGPYFGQLRKTEDFRKLDLSEVLQHFLGYEQQMLLDRLAPAAIPVPTGSMIRVVYHPGGDPPVMAVRLQEVFGMLETPRVNGGNMKIVMHLLSPGFKPV